jgi:hypothetical protein
MDSFDFTDNPCTHSLSESILSGTYGNYCGPTPETDVFAGCVPHGRFGDAPLDAVDAACQRHDLNYCACDRAWIDRRAAVGEPAPQTALSVLTATRGVGLGTRPALEAQGVDEGYFACVSAADTALLRDGIAMRAEAQLTGCADGGPGGGRLNWFCAGDEAPAGTLARFERVNLALFLRALDFDVSRVRSAPAKAFPPLMKPLVLASPLEIAASGSLSPSPTLTTPDGPETSLVRLEEQRRRAFKMALEKRKTTQAASISCAAGAVASIDEAIEARLTSLL